jgi:hypothetical protein
MAAREPYLTPETLEEAGILLAGPDWKLPMSALLGPHHPEGARERIDPRLVRRWAAGERPIPHWVRPVLAELLVRRTMQLSREANRARDLCLRLRKGPHAAP